MSHILKRALIIMLSLLFVYPLIALGLFFSPGPSFAQPPAPVAQSKAFAPCLETPSTRCILARDGTLLAGEWTDSASKTTIILIHGVLASSADYEQAAKHLQAATGANILRIDLRGHGRSGGAAGNAAYAGQYEDDLADIVTFLRQDVPDMHIILAGHSMGGGVIMGYAERRTMPPVDAYLLFAPFLGPDAPSSQMPAGQEPSMKTHLRRIIGIVMLNSIGITALNQQPTLYFNVSQNAPLQHYSFNAMQSMYPSDYHAALSADTRPLLVLVGKQDQTFQADQYPAIISQHQNGHTLLFDNLDHMSILDDQAVFDAIHEWLGKLP